MPLLLILFMVLFTTARHEGAHALVAWLQGGTINEVRLLPGIHPELGFYFGYVDYDGEPTWWTEAAPYLADVMVFVVAFLFLRRFSLRGWWWLGVFLLGLISPLVDLAWGYAGGFWRTGSDVHDLLRMLPPLAIHAAFLTALAGFLLGVRRVRAGAVTAQ